MKRYGLNKKELHDFNTIISHDLIPKLINFADKYNFDRDSIIKYAADVVKALSEMSTFKNFEEGKQ